MSSPETKPHESDPRPLRFVDQVDPGNRPEADAVLDAAIERAMDRLSIEDAAVRLELHIGRLDEFCRRVTDLDPGRKAMRAVELLKDLERDWWRRRGGRGADKAIATEAATDPVTDAAGLGLPLLSLGQGAYRREITGDPRTGRLDIRA